MSSNGRRGPRVVIVGAGIIGAASARELLQRRPDLDLTIIDKEPAVATHQSGNNSGVVHSGIYYTPGSAKAQLVRRGIELLTPFARRHGLPWEQLGKVIVATSVTELDRLDELERRAAANGVETRRLGPTALGRIEPHVAGVAALHVPEVAITSYAAVVEALCGEVDERGGQLLTGVTLTGVDTPADDAAALRLHTDGGVIEADVLLNCAGLHSDRVARMAGADTEVSIVPFRGEYLELTPQSRDLVRGLVYPVPDPRWPFLGVHLTPMVDGTVHVGPNAVLAGGRESYRRGLVAQDALELARNPGLLRLAAQYWRTGAHELARSRSTRLLLRDLQRLVPSVRREDLIPSGSGVRAQALGAHGRLLDDFAFASSPRAVHVLNAPSPAATASLAIAEVVADRAEEQLARVTT